MINYSIADITSCIDNILPDVVFIESREEVFNEYGIIDGSIDIILTYSYCTEKAIPVKMIDHWELSNSTKPNTTIDERDDEIYNNILYKNISGH